MGAYTESVSKMRQARAAGVPMAAAREAAAYSDEQRSKANAPRSPRTGR